MLIIPTLLSERLTLRAPNLGDFEAIAAFRASERSHFVGGPSTEGESWQYLAALIGHWHLRGYGRWIVAETGNEEEALGIVGPLCPVDWPEPEIAWTMFEKGEGKGYAYEAALLARDYAYQTLEWQTAASFVHAENAASLALARKLGCHLDGTFEHGRFGTMQIWRHPSPAEVSA
ncbi:GNAT family N-acetyltransferase [Gymnodinialimonas ceratoperidinii]|uniref:GNAT family N-acetyltransferase n=1 Tax=Gymnodinialimonas ceratoperidinii TaxID=2856823 RepID=A0A8F6YA25_9RHOB|nr:GNAT family N-acetyltransferase [Gymnodinialimonas ceratoperidinii]QXT39534.1 GNAT family N-acetyltransferase [Gymnodinialimonas ceratoperidinii]